MKKRLAILLTLSLLLTAFSPVFASMTDYGAELQKLGIIKGYEDGDLRPENNLTREEAIVTLTRMMGQEEAAMTCNDPAPFSDVPADNWAKPYLCYAKKQGWTNGIGDGKFGLGQKVTIQEYVTFMLRALGYTESDVYENAIKTASNLEMLKDIEDTYGQSPIRRNEVFILMYRTLYMKPRGSNVELIYVLGLAQPEGNETGSEETTYPLEIANYDGETLVVNAKPQRVASLILGTDELLLGLVDDKRVVGLSGQIGNSKSVSLAAEKAADFPKMENNFEVILEQKPDLIIGSSWIKKELLAQIKDSGIAYYGYKSPNTIEEQIAVIRNFATLLGERAKGEEIIADWNKRLAVIKEKAATIKDADKLSVLPYNMHGKTNAKGTIIDEIIYLIGAKNAATEAGLEKREKISKEKIIEIDPDVILLTAWGMDDLDEFNAFVEDMKNDPALQNLKAIKNDRIIVEDGRYMTIVTQHLINGIEFVAKKVYPEVYGE